MQIKQFMKRACLQKNFHWRVLEFINPLWAWRIDEQTSGGVKDSSYSISTHIFKPLGPFSLSIVSTNYGLSNSYNGVPLYGRPLTIWITDSLVCPAPKSSYIFYKANPLIRKPVNTWRTTDNFQCLESVTLIYRWQARYTGTDYLRTVHFRIWLRCTFCNWSHKSGHYSVDVESRVGAVVRALASH